VQLGKGKTSNSVRDAAARKIDELQYEIRESRAKQSEAERAAALKAALAIRAT
jgi:hypothetical protein